VGVEEAREVVEASGEESRRGCVDRGETERERFAWDDPERSSLSPWARVLGRARWAMSLRERGKEGSRMAQGKGRCGPGGWQGREMVHGTFGLAMQGRKKRGGACDPKLGGRGF
jgi:hypothetical protein